MYSNALPIAHRVLAHCPLHIVLLHIAWPPTALAIVANNPWQPQLGETGHQQPPPLAPRTLGSLTGERLATNNPCHGHQQSLPWSPTALGCLTGGRLDINNPCHGHQQPLALTTFAMGTNNPCHGPIQAIHLSMYKSSIPYVVGTIEVPICRSIHPSIHPSIHLQIENPIWYPSIHLQIEHQLCGGVNAMAQCAVGLWPNG